MFKKLFQNIQSKVWATQTLHANSRILRTARITWYSIKSFQDNRAVEKASALTYYSLLSLVPLLAMAFAISKGFGIEATIQNFLNKTFADKPEFAAQLQEFATSLLSTTNSGIIAGVGMVVLFWSVIKLLGNIESALNHIWEVKKQRSFMRKISDYIGVVFGAVLAPGSRILLITLETEQNGKKQYGLFMKYKDVKKVQEFFQKEIHISGEYTYAIKK